MNVIYEKGIKRAALSKRRDLGGEGRQGDISTVRKLERE